jgi:phosphomannomutase
MNYIFDVDGTLTPSRNKIDPEFADWFVKFCDNHDVYIVTGSDRPKTLEQIGSNIYNKCKRVYQNCGNDVWEQDNNIRTTKVDWDPTIMGFCSKELAESKYPIRTGIHCEYRIGLMNFSIVGRGANKEQRADYVKHDKLTNERRSIAERFNKLFRLYEACLGGDTGIDIFPKGRDKSQIMPDLDGSSFFFGDRIFEGGNDYSLALAVLRASGEVAKVEGWEETWRILKQLA